jgi:hypothetical protein
MRVGFLLNHNELHQVPHIVPYAFELSRLAPAFACTILSSSAEEEDFAREIATGYPEHRARFERLAVPPGVDTADRLLASIVFLRKSAVLRWNARRLSEFDALVVPEMTSLSLRRSGRFARTKFIFTGHGAGDNRHGGSFNPRICQFDLSLMPGRKYAEGLVEIGYLPADRYGISGYVKLEAMARMRRPALKLFDDERPIVVYNPHHAASLTSWHRHGEAVLDFFARSGGHNLIFAPHVLLFKRKWTKGARLPARFKSGGNLLIDTGSRASADMTYLKAADIYLGDVSSQVYEFLERPRPCIFFGAHGTAWENDPSYRQWTFGPLLRDVGELGGALEQAVATHGRYRPAQERGFADTFAQGPEPAAIRGARIIQAFLETGQVPREWR